MIKLMLIEKKNHNMKLMKHKLPKNKLILILSIMAIMLLAFYYFDLYSPIKDMCIYLTNHFKLPGLFIVSIFLELFVPPITAGFFVAIAVEGGTNIFLATSIAVSGSMVVGILYYFLGKANKRIVNVSRYGKLWDKFLQAVHRNSLFFLFLFSATTGPFSIISFFSGNTKISFHKYLVIGFIGRFVKFILYALIGLGLLKLLLG